VLKIRRLQLTLPAGFTGSPQQVARLVAEELARRPLHGAGDQRIDRLAPPPIEVGRRAGERQVAEPAARAIDRAIGQAIGRRK
jgi:hypothetical protein